jgi:L-asparaginase
MDKDPETGGLRPAQSAEELIKGLNIPERVQLTLEDHSERLDSTNVTYEDRVKMAEAIARQYDNHDAFVILHGTDSIAYTTSGITMIFKETLQKPIIVVGSQMSKIEPGTDMRNQLENAIRIAVEFSNTRNKIAGVFSLAGTDVFKGARLRKTHDSSFNFLNTPGVHPVASVEQPALEIKHDLVRHTDERMEVRGLHLEKEFEDNVATISVTGNTPPIVLTSLVDSGVIRGVIIQCLGAGNIPDVKKEQPGWQYKGEYISMIDAIKIATEAGVHVGVVSPFEDGKVNFERYDLGQKVASAGAISLESLTPEMADAKFRQAIAKYPNDPQQIQRFISVDFDEELLRGHNKTKPGSRN